MLGREMLGMYCPDMGGPAGPGPIEGPPQPMDIGGLNEPDCIDEPIGIGGPDIDMAGPPGMVGIDRGGIDPDIGGGKVAAPGPAAPNGGIEVN
mmetsp:Transcript_16006/g.37742  ORF Transcript_16006/g.37742 Transcript_16006/m.37742 type:complete len:93 (-) Transcript_16006:146-424(-)|eukprot:CAMPEP_0178440860 /NCGR_PEP_ID=MMETSP0689_2-20121128/37072_1 /TAXON_ID=160604 /ORGANISM="Amphidinium massartii, Strain CS-259" /LENGTH=92 /DNA_ID=CAMNT_0020063799 /DNA_START=258 /DNA_END=536 /DNA_ORIENTATION=-